MALSLKLPSAVMRRPRSSSRSARQPSRSWSKLLTGNWSTVPMSSVDRNGSKHMEEENVDEHGMVGTFSINSGGTVSSGGAARSGKLFRRNMFLQHCSSTKTQFGNSSCNSSSRSMASQDLTSVYDVDESEIGRGGFGRVFRAKLKGSENMVRAVKTVRKTDPRAERLVRSEVDILRRLDHPCICRLFETFEDDRAIYLVMEYIDGRELFDEIVDQGYLDEARSGQIMQQVFSGLQYCHERAVVHRDLKPENIMVQRKSSIRGVFTPQAQEVKLIDFGLAIKYNKGSRFIVPSVMGTEDYLAPEVSRGICGPLSDMWGAGMVLHCLLTGGLPKRVVKEGTIPLDVTTETYNNVTLAGKELLNGLLQVDLEARFSAAAAASHAWIQGGASPMRSDRRPQLVRSQIESLKAFQQSVKLRRAALTALAMNMASQQLAELRETYLQLDVDGDGRISRDELSRSLLLAHQSCDGVAANLQERVDAVFDAVDTDGSNHIEYTEWLAAASEAATHRSEEELRAAFRVFDTDEDGFISGAELARVLSLSPEETACSLVEFDLNGDGVLDFAEFKELVQNAAPDPSVIVRRTGTGPPAARSDNAVAEMEGLSQKQLLWL